MINNDAKIETINVIETCSILDGVNNISFGLQDVIIRANAIEAQRYSTERQGFSYLLGRLDDSSSG